MATVPSQVSTGEPEVQLTGPTPKENGKPNPFRKILSLKGYTPGSNYFHLLGLQPDETDIAAINSAADRQASYARQFQMNSAEAATAVLNEIEDARNCLIDMEKRAAHKQKVLREKPVESAVEATSEQVGNAVGVDTVVNKHLDTPPDAHEPPPVAAPPKPVPAKPAASQTATVPKPASAPKRPSAPLKKPVPARPAITVPTSPPSTTEFKPPVAAAQPAAVPPPAAPAAPPHSPAAQPNGDHNDPRWNNNGATAAPAQQKPKQQSLAEKRGMKKSVPWHKKPVTWISTGVAVLGGIAVAIWHAGKKEEVKVPNPQEENPTAPAVAEVDIENTTHGQRPIVKDPEPEEVAVAPVPQVETGPTPEELELARLERERIAKEQEEARKAAEEEAKRQAAEEAAAIKEAQKEAQRQFSSNAFNKYKGLRDSYGGSDVNQLIGAASSEQDPVMRAGLAFVAAERAVRGGSVEDMNRALGVASGLMPPRDLALVKNFILQNAESSLPARQYGNTRLAVARDLIGGNWDRYDDRDFATAKASDAIAKRYVSGVNYNHVEGGTARERGTYVNATRDAVNAAGARTTTFEQMHQDQTPQGIGTTLIAIEGRWDDALPHLAGSSNTSVADAAGLDLRNPQTAEDLHAAARAWADAAAADPSNAKMWNARAAALLNRAKQKNPKGALALDISATETEFRRKGIDVENAFGGQEGEVEGRGETAARVVAPNEVPVKEVSLIGARITSANLSKYQSSITPGRLARADGISVPTIDGEDVEGKYISVTPNKNADRNKQTRFAIDLPDNAISFSGAYVQNNERSMGVDVIAYAELENGTLHPLRNISAINFGANGDEEHITTKLPQGSESIMFIIGMGTGNDAKSDHFFLVNPAAKVRDNVE